MQLFWCEKTRASRVLWMIEETGQPFELVRIDIRDEKAKARVDFLVASPMGKVPALIDGDVALAESGAICTYLADRYPESGLAPAIDDPRRGRYLYWMFYAPAVMEPCMAEKWGGFKANRGTHGWGDYPIMLETLRDALNDNHWLQGEDFSAADVMVGSTLVFMRQFGLLEETETVLNSYADRCLERPANLRALSAEQNENGAVA